MEIYWIRRLAFGIAVFFFSSWITGCKSGESGSCLKITCLDTRDSVSSQAGEIRTRFLIESVRDTLAHFDIRSACGCEYPEWNKEMKVFPGKPDTITIVSNPNEFSGSWQKESTISSGDCRMTFYTGPWIIID